GDGRSRDSPNPKPRRPPLSRGPAPGSRKSPSRGPRKPPSGRPRWPPPDGPRKPPAGRPRWPPPDGPRKPPSGRPRWPPPDGPRKPPSGRPRWPPDGPRFGPPGPPGPRRAPSSSRRRRPWSRSCPSGRSSSRWRRSRRGRSGTSRLPDAPPALTVACVLDRDAALGQHIAQAVGRPPVARGPSGGTLFQQIRDVSFELRDGRAHDAKNLIEVEEEIQRTPRVSSRQSPSVNPAVEIADDVEDGC